MLQRHPLAKLYHNNGNGTFTEDALAALAGVQRRSAAWGDYDNDGRLDILLLGRTAPTRPPVYHNDGQRHVQRERGRRI